MWQEVSSSYFYIWSLKYFTVSCLFRATEVMHSIIWYSRHLSDKMFDCSIFVEAFKQTFKTQQDTNTVSKLQLIGWTFWGLKYMLLAVYVYILLWTILHWIFMFRFRISLVPNKDIRRTSNSIKFSNFALEQKNNSSIVKKAFETI